MYRHSLRLQQQELSGCWCLKRCVKTVLCCQSPEHSKGAGELESHNTLLTARCALLCDPSYFGQTNAQLRVVKPNYAAFPLLEMALLRIRIECLTKISECKLTTLPRNDGGPAIV